MNLENPKGSHPGWGSFGVPCGLLWPDFRTSKTHAPNWFTGAKLLIVLGLERVLRESSGGGTFLAVEHVKTKMRLVEAKSDGSSTCHAHSTG